MGSHGETNWGLTKTRQLFYSLKTSEGIRRRSFYSWYNGAIRRPAWSLNTFYSFRICSAAGIKSGQALATRFSTLDKLFDIHEYYAT